jgi:hypothetical protein
MEGAETLLGRGFGLATGGPVVEVRLLVPLAVPLVGFKAWEGRTSVADDGRATAGRDEEACEAGRAV